LNFFFQNTKDVYSEVYNAKIPYKINKLYMNNLEKIIKVLENARARKTPWTMMEAFLKECDLYLTFGWDASIFRLKKILDEEYDLEYIEKATEKVETLITLYKGYLLVSDKSVFIQNMTQESLSKLIEKIKEIEIERSDFHETYPFSLPEHSLKRASLTPKPIEINLQQDGMSIVFCSKKEAIEREEIKVNDFGEDPPNRLLNYDKIWGSKTITEQFYDVVFLNHKHNLIEVRLDAHRQCKDEDKADSLQRIVQSFEEFIKPLIDSEKVLKSYINLFPLVSRLYEASEEGKVVELHFLTDEGLSEKAKMRTGGCDLRQETFHQAGRQAVHHINPYHITIEWEREKTCPRLTLHGKRYHLNNLQLTLENIVFENCFYIDDYSFALGQISKYFNRNRESKQSWIS